MTLVGVLNWVELRLKTGLRKFKGGGATPPPMFTTEQALFSFVGVFLTLAILANINDALVRAYGEDYSIVIG